MLSGKFFLAILFLFVLIVPVKCMPLTCQSLCVFAINANGMGYTAKIDAISATIQERKPHIFVVSETKNQSNVGNKLGLRDYQIFESPGIKSTASVENADGTRGQGRIDKWGIIMGIRGDLQIYNHKIKVPPDLKGRAAAVDIIMPTPGGKGIKHRVIAAYAPAKISVDEQTRKFWDHISEICKDSPDTWSLIGDLNATVATYEGKNTNRENRKAYLKFLRENEGVDLWTKIIGRNYRTHNTTNPRGEGEGGQIIDRVVVHGGLGTDGDVRILNRFIGGTDHRPIWANLLISDGTIENNPNEEEIPEIVKTPRVRYPSKMEKDKFKDFEREALRWHDENKELDQEVTTDEQFMNIYLKLTDLITIKAAEIFGVIKKTHAKTLELPRNEESDRITCQARALGRYIRSTENPGMHLGSDDERTVHKLKKTYEKDKEYKTWKEYVQICKKDLYKKAYKVRARLAYERAARIEGGKIFGALKGGSAKTLMCRDTYVSAPLAVNPLKESEGIEPNEREIVSDPAGVKRVTTQYFKNLYKPDKECEMPKPWMDTPEIVKIRSEVEKDPFIWPQKLDIEEFRSIVRTGNPRPAPGPDGWEKWVVKNLPDEVMRLVVKCHNYIEKHNRFPGEITDMILCIIYKKGVSTNLMNWRGVMISNFLAGIPLSHLTQRLTRYATDKGIIPNTQVATQKGVQARDLTSLLSEVKTWAHRNEETVYIVKRDQMKGFDFLSPKGFHDAIIAYGLPESIIRLDEAAQRENKCFPRTAYGPADPFTIRGLTKQGGALSPLKSTFTTSMGHRWINDRMKDNPDSLTIRTKLGMNQEGHSEDDGIEIKLNEVECMDDTLILAKTEEAIREATYQKEVFQFAYGWMTSWPKTLAFVLNPKADTPTHIELKSISPKDRDDPLKESTHRVELIRNRIEFMRVWIDEPETRLAEIEEYVETFKFPTFTKRMPITLARKMVKQIMTARIRAMINLQPLSPEGADKVDKMISLRIHEMMKMPYRPNTDIMTLPVKMGGLDFPNIKRMNAGITVEGLRRDLNHHVKIYKDMAKITLAEWTCKLNKCINPIIQNTDHKDKNRTARNSMPQSWRTAKDTMKETGIEMFKTDNTEWARGKIAIDHVLNASKGRVTIMGRELNTLRPQDRSLMRKIGAREIKDIGKWDRNRDGLWKWTKKGTREIENIKGRKLTKPQNLALDRVQKIMSTIRPHKIFGGNGNTMTERDVRRKEATEWIKYKAEDYGDQNKPENVENRDWGSDGSVRPATAEWDETRSITTAVVGRKRLRLKTHETSTSILQGEVLGLIGQAILASEYNGPRRGITDHLNSQRLIKDITAYADPETKLRSMNGRSYYRWLLRCTADHPMDFRHVKSHTGRQDADSRINEEADELAGQIHEDQGIIDTPAPTFDMDELTIYKKGIGWVESNCKELTENILQKKSRDRLMVNPRMALDLYDNSPHPPYPYTHATSAFSAVVQLYARSGQLPFKSEMKRRGYGEDESCIFGCNKVETADHIFVRCDRFSQWRVCTRQKLTEEVTKKMEGEEWSRRERRSILRIIEKSFTDDADTWPLIQSTYYQGHVPGLAGIIGNRQEDKTKRSTIHNALHMAYIRLAARIMGDYQKEAARKEGF